MALAARLEQFFARKGIAYTEMPTPAAANLEAVVTGSGQPEGDFIQATLLIDVGGPVMVVHGFDSTLDPEALYRLSGRRLQVLTTDQAMRLFDDCQHGFIPPIGGAYNLAVLVDDDVVRADRVLMTGGRGDAVVELRGRDFRLATAGAGHGHLVIRGSGVSDSPQLSLDEVAEKLQRLYRLPPMPALALRILRLTTSSETSARELAELIELDPSLAAQILRYARSALFNYPGQIHSVQDAVTRVLGFDRVAHIALGIASVRAFDVPRKGSLGMNSFWRHSLYSAFLCQTIAGHIGSDKALAYLCGLLHNFGLLLIGHLFPSEFQELTVRHDANPEASLQSLEQQVFGQAGDGQILAIGHGSIGGILHRLWQMPDAVVKAAAMHQQSSYHGDHEREVLMVQLANAVLKTRDIGDEFNPDDVPALLESLGLGPEVLATLEQEIDRVGPDLDALANSLSS